VPNHIKLLHNNSQHCSLVGMGIWEYRIQKDSDTELSESKMLI